MSSREDLRAELNQRLAQYLRQRPIPGLSDAARRSTFIEQVVDSERRIEFIRQIRSRPIDPRRRDPASPLFDPIRAALLCVSEGEFDEACWLIFLAIHCGKHGKDGWRLVREIYAGPRPGAEWTMARVNGNFAGFDHWLASRYAVWTATDTSPRFGNHRKYETLDPTSASSTTAVIRSYLDWANAQVDHQTRFNRAIDAADGDRVIAFNQVYKSMSAVIRFGRLAKFDYLCMLGKCGLTDIYPGHPYLAGATGPRAGATRLFGFSDLPRSTQAAVALANALEIGMQSIEDAMCNWDKNPDANVRFRG